MSSGKDFDALEVHRVKQGDPADRKSYTPLDGEIIQTFDGLSSKAYIGANNTAGGFLIGPSGVFYAVENAATDLVLATPVPWGNQQVITEEFAHSQTVNADEITINEDGIYSITVMMTGQWSATTKLEINIQRHNGTVWQTRPGAKTFQDGISGEQHPISAQLVDAFLEGWKVRVLASNYNFIAGQIACVSTYSSIQINRIR